MASAIAYPLLLLVAAVALRFVGERWWVTTVALYLPRLVLGAPLPFIVFGRHSAYKQPVAVRP